MDAVLAWLKDIDETIERRRKLDAPQRPPQTAAASTASYSGNDSGRRKEKKGTGKSGKDGKAWGQPPAAQP